MNNNFINNFNFSNRNVYILGGSGLIGLKTSEVFIELGANLVILDKKKPKKILDIKKYRFEKIDIKKIEKINFNKIFKENGNPDIFINASYPRDNNWHLSSFNKLKLKYLKSNIDLHLNSYAWTAKIFADRMVKSKKKGSIILLSSIYGIVGQNLNLYKETKMHENAIYSIIKSGIINYVRQMSSFYGHKGIRVNSISPGGLYGHDVSSRSKVQNQIFLKNYCRQNPLSRLGYAEEIASSIVFLSSENSSYTTGANLIIDGGITSIL